MVWWLTSGLGLWVEARQAATPSSTWTSLSHISPSETIHTKRVNKTTEYIHGRKPSRFLPFNDF